MGGAGQPLFVEANRGQEHPSVANELTDAPLVLADAKDKAGRAEAVEVKGNGEAHAGDRGRPEWRWWNPFTWFSWGIDWSEAVDQELALVRQLNQTFGTGHTRLDQFTAQERAKIEQALGQKFNWEAASAIRASERELEIRDKVLIGSQVSLVAAGIADASAGGVAVVEATALGGKPVVEITVSRTNLLKVISRPAKTGFRIDRPDAHKPFYHWHFWRW